ncbi:hypothetical protein H310_02952 [Aphanomyces invadans]|uniref:COMM domain-containing protein 3 n=1 Tax=Aphanomyces invadans TaxID=157072 RepID=A0A024UKT2_9STRA|nr:hypothetical protein H310_02952 [Aphanomyces invadans]ETW06800.1 hypothetical protein H310_02952 [Aphanomyces invadans]|eukprot:XP_008864875.1 hypothetical protein H310_02952 [Aphanomyces invadans]
MALGNAIESQVQRAVTALPGPSLRQLFALAVEQLIHSSPSSPSLSLLDNASSPEQSIALKEAYAAICILVADVAKQNLTRESTRRLIEELGVTEANVDDIASLLHASLPNIRALGGVSGLELDEVVDFSWRLDHCIRSNTFGNIREPLYLIVLSTKSPRTGHVSTIEFNCTVAQLEDLVYKLQEATEQIDKVVASFSDLSSLL